MGSEPAVGASGSHVVATLIVLSSEAAAVSYDDDKDYGYYTTTVATLVLTHLHGQTQWNRRLWTGLERHRSLSLASVR